MAQLQIFKKWTLFLFIVCFAIMSFLGCRDDGKRQGGSSEETPPSPFISVYRLDNDNESITLPLRSGYKYNFQVDWGDGSSNEITVHDDSDITHTYAKAGEYTLTISGVLEAWSFNNGGSKDKLISVTDLGSVGWKNLEGAFEGCRNLREVLGGNVSRMTKMNRMFKGATSIKNIDFSGWNFALVTEMDEAFSEVTLPTRVYNTLLHRLFETSTQENFTLNVGGFKYDSRAESVRQNLKERGWTINDGGFSFFISVWRISSNNEAIALPLPPGYNYNFQVDWGDGSSSEVTAHDDSDITHTYVEAGDYTVTISGTLEAWNFDDYATTHASQFISVKDLGDVGWKSLEKAFIDCINLKELSGGNVSNVTDMNNMFVVSEIINLDISDWDTSSVTNMSYMFSETEAINPDLSRWDTSSVTNMSSMFAEALGANPDVSRWDTSNVTNMNNMFFEAAVANPDVSRWDTSNVTNMNSVFAYTVVANPDVSRWDTSGVRNMNFMFIQAQAAQPEMTQWDFRHVTAMRDIFRDVTLSTKLYSGLLNRIHLTSQQDDVPLHGGNSKYNSSATEARTALRERGWTINDGGLETLEGD